MGNHTRFRLTPPKPGGKRAGAGRPAGTIKNIASYAEKLHIGELARKHTQLAIDTIVELASSAETESVRLTAAGQILDRGYGRPCQSHEVNSTSTVVGLQLKPEDLMRLTSDELGNLELLLAKLQRGVDADKGSKAPKDNPREGSTPAPGTLH